MNPLEKLRLPKNKKIKLDHLEMFKRSGRTTVSTPNKMTSIPVTLDPEAMQAVLEEALMHEHRKQMEQQQDQFLMQLEQSRLPPVDPNAMMPPE